MNKQLLAEYLTMYNCNNIQRLRSCLSKKLNNRLNREIKVNSPLYEKHNVEIKERREEREME